MSNITFEHLSKQAQFAKKMEGKDIAGKLRLTRVPPKSIKAIAKVREYGAAKYVSDDNWKAVPMEHYIDAAYRHLLEMIEDPYSVDSESGLPHSWHLATNAAFLAALTPGPEKG